MAKAIAIPFVSVSVYVFSPLSTPLPVYAHMFHAQVRCKPEPLRGPASNQATVRYISFVLAQVVQKLFIRHGLSLFPATQFLIDGAAPARAGLAASSVQHIASQCASAGASPACSNVLGSLSRRAYCPRVGICPAAAWHIPAVHHKPDNVPLLLSRVHHGNTGVP